MYGLCLYIVRLQDCYLQGNSCSGRSITFVISPLRRHQTLTQSSTAATHVAFEAPGPWATDLLHPTVQGMMCPMLSTHHETR